MLGLLLVPVVVMWQGLARYAAGVAGADTRVLLCLACLLGGVVVPLLDVTMLMLAVPGLGNRIRSRIPSPTRLALRISP